MFPVTRPFRQGLATLALVVLTVLPTAFVAAWAWRIHRPGHLRDVEIELGRQLGLQVTIEAVQYPRPGEVVFRGNRAPARGAARRGPDRDRQG